MASQISQRRNFARPASDELKRKSVRGGFVVVAAQGAKVLLQTGTVVVLARLLSPEDFGLTGMVATLRPVQRRRIERSHGSTPRRDP
jgi:hypothetical protein